MFDLINQTTKKWLMIGFGAEWVIVLVYLLIHQHHERPQCMHSTTLSQKFINQTALLDEGLVCPDIMTCPLDGKYSCGCNHNNPNGCPRRIIKNLVHYYMPDGCEIDAKQMISMKSVWVNHRPTAMYVHANCSNMTGKYWEGGYLTPGEKALIRIKRKTWEAINSTLSSFTYKDRQWINADLPAIKIMRDHGGIFLQNDIYLRRPLYPFMNREAFVFWDKNKDESIATKVLIGHEFGRIWAVWHSSLMESDNPTKTFSREVKHNPILKDLFYSVRGDRFQITDKNEEKRCKVLYRTTYEDWNDWHLVKMGSRSRRYGACENDDNIIMSELERLPSSRTDTTIGSMINDIISRPNMKCCSGDESVPSDLIPDLSEEP